MDKLVFFLLFLLPFVIFPIGISPFETPKVYIAEIGIIILLVWYLLKHPFSNFLRKEYMPLGLLGLLGLLHLFIAPSETAFFGNAFRMQGVFLLWLLMVFTFLSSRITLKIPSEKIIVILLTLQLVVAILIEGNVASRAIGSLGEPNSLAAYGIFLWPFLFLRSSFWGAERLQNQKEPVDIGRVRMTCMHFLTVLGTSIALLLIAFSGSRSGLVAFGIEAVFIFLISFLKWPLMRVFIITFLLFLITLSLPFFEKETLYENRGEIWQTAVYAGYEHPVLGWGFGNIGEAFKEYNFKLYNNLQGYYVDSGHNLFLDFWLQGGFIGLATLIWVVYYAIRVFLREKNALLLCILLGILSVFSFNPLSIALILQFWWLMGRSMNNTVPE